MAAGATTPSLNQMRTRKFAFANIAAGTGTFMPGTVVSPRPTAKRPSVTGRLTAVTGMLPFALELSWLQ